MSLRNGGGERYGGPWPVRESESIGDHTWAPMAAEPSPIEALWAGTRRVFGTRTGRSALLAVLGVTAVVMVVGVELRTSRIQARLLAPLAQEATHETGPGPSPSIRFPEPGPYDLRLGHTRLPDFLHRLNNAGYHIDQQARSSDRLLSLTDRGVYPLYHEKAQAGLQVLDRDGGEIFVARYPERIYAAFDEIPPLIVRTVLFLENRELLDSRAPYRNPAIEWDRALRALLHFGVRQVEPTYPRLGGSTLATQLEKMRHSPDGRTRSIGDKTRQIASASLRAYLGGERTVDAQRRIVTAYLNSIPLAAVPGYGEVIGLGDGLWAWYGADLTEVNTLLLRVGTSPGDSDDLDVVRAYRQVLSLLVALRRPSGYLSGGSDALTRQTDDVLDSLSAAGIIHEGFAASAKTARPELRRAFFPRAVSFVDRKPASAIRASLRSTLGLDTIYDLDRTDVTVVTTLDQPIQRAVTTELGRLTDSTYAASAGLTGDGLLRRGDPAAVVYGLVVYERGADANLLRVQADSLDQPLDVNAATKLELGSTAKLRTLVTYLELIATLHAEHGGRAASEIAAAASSAGDPVTRWVLDHLRRDPQATLPDLLEVALERRYSASPSERFVTGGGVHTFANFDADDNARVMSVRDAFRQSVNLVFIRLMRDIVRYHVVRLPGWSPALVADRDHPARDGLLQRFADREGIVFLDRFLDRYRGLSQDEAVDTLVAAGRQRAERLAVIHRTLYPSATTDDLADFLDRRLGPGTSPERVGELHREYGPDRWSLADRGYLAGLHPLDLWLVSDLVTHPGSSRADRLSRSKGARQDAYAWLFRTRRKAAQDRRIHTELERDAFVEVHRRWKRVGYPFDHLVPSYATAIGSSGDNPAGLAGLIGILQSAGRLAPTRRIASLRFAEGTPTETWLSPGVSPGTQVLDATVATFVRRELVGVVEHGTGRRIAGALTLHDGTKVEIGGKTGTGDNRVEFRDRGTSRVLNRTATFTFLIGERLYGTLTAYVDGDRASDYRFTSALPVQVLKHLLPTLQPLCERLTAGAIQESRQRPSTEGTPDFPLAEGT